MKQPDYSINPREVKHFYDLERGQLIVGEHALQREVGGINQLPDHIRSLGNLLLDSSLIVEPDRYEKVDSSRWNLPTYRKFGRWLDLAVTPPDSLYTYVSQGVIDRSYRFGVGVTSVRISSPRKFGSLITFYEESGINYHCAPGQYRHWTQDRFVDYIEGVFLSLKPGQNLTTVLSDKAELKEGPGLKVIRGNAGNILLLLAERGYPDIPRWDIDDFLNWGTSYMLANSGTVPSKSKLDSLSTRKRGPSGRTIFNHFDSLLDYQDQISSRYHETVKFQEARTQERVATLRSKRRGSDLILPAINSGYYAGWLALRLGSQYLLVDALDREISEDKKERLSAATRQRDFMAGLNRVLPPSSVMNIRGVAQNIGLYEDIWPTHNPEYLQICQKRKAA